MSSVAKALAWSDLREGLTLILEFTVTNEDMASYGALSGDRNPLHVDAAFAQRKGFEGPVVYGGILVMQLSRLIGMELPGRDAIWNRLDIQFRRSLYVGARATLHAEITHMSEATRALEIKFQIRSAGDLIATGVVGVVVRGSD